ncbi:MAG: hypothetical protein FD152_3178 [Xanthobacteraceae bacterium]|nr:MAG: hypothetical protein FD152_3178 [Xanthobacteraceae bacterium]
MADRMTTTVHAYNFDTSTDAGRAGYADLKARLTAMGLECFETHGGGSHYKPELDGRAVELETKHLFRDQWNTAPIEGVSDKGLRLFDWAQDVNSPIGAPPRIKRGHWLEQTPAMREARRNTMKCGYCGKQEPAAKGYVFCPHCLDSEYLGEGDLHLTRMASVEDTNKPRAPLTEAEKGHLLPLYREAQIHGSTERGRARIASERAKVIEKHRKVTTDATTERDAMLWLMDRGIRTDNVIFYSHTGRFCFGWRKPVGGAVLAELLNIMSEFPAPYDIKTEDGRTLSGEG